VEERGEEAEEPRCRSPELARTDPHRTQPIIVKSSSTLLVSFPLLLFSPPQTNPLYKAKNTRETEREKIIRLTASSTGSSGSWFPVPYRRISTGGGVYGRNRPSYRRGHPKWTQDAQIEETGSTGTGRCAPILPIYDALAPSALGSGRSPDPGVGLARPRRAFCQGYLGLFIFG
jgi:hypothetical protein